jgi:UDP-N-acetylglucosamine:LPS N-acetylglucosamine transferase
MKDPHLAEEINSRGSAAVLEACRLAGVKRVVYASTIWVYSDTESEYVDEATLLPPPGHLYTATKLAGELYCRSYQELYGIDYTILRFGIPYGPRAREAAVIPAFTNKAFAGEPLTLSGDGLQSRRFVYVEDLAEGVVAGLADVACNRVYNLVSDENVTIRQIAELVQEYVGNTEIVFGPARPGDLGSKIVSGVRAERELGWTAATPFREGVRRYIDWRIAQRELAAASAAAADAAGVDDAAGFLAAHDESGTEPESPQKILIVSADIGEGHDLPARAIAREFQEENPEAQIAIVNSLAAMGPMMTNILRDNSAFMFRWVPWWFDFQYRLLMHFGPTRWFTRKLLTTFGARGLLRLIKAHNPDLIVSTYPGATAILGEMRRRGKLTMPCYSSITDLAGLHYWAHPGIDMHFITHPESAEEVEAIAGPGSVRWAKPPTSPAFLEPRDRTAARAALDLPAEGTVIVVSGGGWGVGDLVGATRVALEVPDATVLCLCGHNDRVRDLVSAQLGGDPRLRVMGFTKQMGDVLGAANALVHSSAGLTVLEAIIRGCPVISYGFGYGHVRASNSALERFGLGQVVKDRDQLKPAIDRALAMQPEPDSAFARRAGTAQLILSNTRVVTPTPAWRVRAERAASALAATLAVAWIALSASVVFALAADLGATPALTAVTTPQRQVGVLVDASPQQVQVLTQALAASGMHASFALLSASPSTADLVAAAGDGTPVPRLPDGGLFSWPSTRHRLRLLASECGWHHRHFLYASTGSSLGQYVLAKGAGGRLIGGQIRLASITSKLGRLHAGEVVEIRVTSVAAAIEQLQRLQGALLTAHLHAVPVQKLLRDSGTSV